ncbi:MAG TPA: glutaredoxin domain-containing protein [Bacteroidales bacterium]
MKTVASLTDFTKSADKLDKAFLLLYKSGSEQSDCAVRNLKTALNGHDQLPVFLADVSEVKDIHPAYHITTVPSLLIFENQQLVSVIKGCNEAQFYKALAENAVFQAKAKAEGKAVKRVTVYSTPTCSWCNTLKAWLRKNNIPFAEIDVSRDEKAAQDLVRRTGQQGVPQTDINGQVVVGFNQQKLKELLEIQ